MDVEDNTATHTEQKRKRGRPATGRKSELDSRKAVAKSEELNLPQYGGKPGSTTLELLKEGISLMDTPPVDVMDFQAVRDRTSTYLERCYSVGRRPAIAAYALYLGIPRTTLKSYYEGRNNAIDPNSLTVIKYVYSLVDTCYEQQMTDGDMNVIAGIFLLRNNLNYTNTDTVEIIAKQPDNNSMSIDDIVTEYSTETK